MTITRTRVLSAALVCAALAYLWWVIAGWSTGVRVQGDALVYRAGARAFLDGNSIYTDRLSLEFGAGEMFFTYGPLALLLFVPITILPPSASFVVLAVVSWVALWLALSLWCRVTGWFGPHWVTAGLAAAVVASMTTPVIDHLQIGQVNALLLLLATLDLLLPKTRWPRGMLLGIAIAIKITPAALLLLPLLKRDVRTIVLAGATAAMGVAASWLVVPREATYFWFTAFRDPGRVGNLRSADNQSMRGLAERWIDGPLGGVLWLLGVMAVVVLVSWVSWKVLIPKGDSMGVAALVFLLPALLSPVAWTHHWVWSFPLMLWLVSLARRGSLGAGLLAGLGILVLVFFPIDSFDPETLIPGTAAWSPVQAALSGGFVYWAVAALVATPWLKPRELSAHAA